MKDEEKWGGVEKMYEALEMLRTEVYKELPIQQISTFLIIVRNEGITYKQIAKELSLHPSTISRNCKELGDYAEEGPQGERIGKGHGLIFSSRNEYNLRELSAYLTPKGRRVAEALEKLISG